ncbi:MAG: glycosyltransferase family 9 protein [Bdellovibrio sp.]|nr:MAG: glycosyltransferase family 9 protein [Bdellovibrio sp.]
MTGCRYFSGYRPCGHSEICSPDCPSKDEIQTSILIIHLGAQGAVVRSTSLLAPIRRKFHRAHITWVTDAPMDQMLAGHPLIDRVLSSNHGDLLQLKALHFDVAFVLDKSLRAYGVLKNTQADQIHGFVASERTGGILPATPAAEELWQLGLSNERKFFQNQKPETQLLAEALELPYQRDEYNLHLHEDEWSEVRRRARAWRNDIDQPIIGINTGCSSLMPAKKWTVEFHRQVIADLLRHDLRNIVLLGGREDRLRNQRIAAGFPIHCSNTDLGIRDGAQSVAACDIVITGDSLGLHLAIAWRKGVVVWFGPTCPQEIDLFDRGVSLQAEVSCCPCWQASCRQVTMCYDRIPLEKIRQAVFKMVSKLTRGGAAAHAQ